MRSPVRALIWEQWRQVRLVVLAGVAVTYVGSWGLHYAMLAALDRDVVERGLGPQNMFREWASVSMSLASIALILVAAALLFSHSSPRNLRMGLPPRILNLPVSTARLAAVQAGFRFAVMGLTALVLGLAFSTIDPAYLPMVLPFAALALLGYAYASALALTIGIVSPVAASAAIIVTTGPVLTTLFYLLSIGFAESPRAAVIVYVTLVAALFAVSFLRFAGIRSVPAGERVLHSRAHLPLLRRSRPGEVGLEGFRVECRRLGWITPSFAAAAFSLGVVPIAVTGFDFGLEGAGLLLFYLPCAAAFIVGMALIARDHRDNVTGVARYMWTRPTTVQQAVLDRMKAVALSMAITWLIPFVLYVLIDPLDMANQPLGPIEQFFFVTLSFAGVLMLAWLIVWAPYIPIAYWVYLSIIGVLQHNFRWGVDDMYTVVLIPSVALLATFAVLARAAWKRRLFNTRTVARFTALCLACCAASCWWLNCLVREDGQGWNRPAYWLAAASLGLVPMLTLFAHGVLLDRIRHGALLGKLPARAN